MSFLILLCGRISAVPVVTLIAPPEDYICNTTNSSNFIFNVTDSNASSVNCTLFWDTGSENFSNVPFNGTPVDAGYLTDPPNRMINWYISCINDFGNLTNSNNRTFLVNRTFASGPINVSLVFPGNGETIYSKPFNLRFFVGGGNVMPANCTLWDDIETPWHSDNIFITTEGNRDVSITNASNNNYSWNVYCFEQSNSSNGVWASAVNWTFTLNAGTGGGGGGGGMWSWGGFVFDDMPYAANGPGCNPQNPNAQPGENCPNNKTSYDLGAIWSTDKGENSTINSTHLGMQIMAPNLTTSTLCSGSDQVYYIIQIDNDSNKATGCPENGECMPGADVQIMIINSTDSSFSDWNGSSFDNVDAAKTSRLIVSRNCSSLPTIIRLAINKSDMGWGNVKPTLMIASTNGTGEPADMLFPGGGMQEKPQCPFYDGKGEAACINESKQQYGLFCKWENFGGGYCDPDFASMPQTCDYFCGYCNVTNCNSFSSNRGSCKWENNFCKEQFFDPGFDCSQNCFACINKDNCFNNGPKEGMGSACGWIDEFGSPNGGFCDKKEMIAKKDCNQTCFACMGTDQCYNSAANCSWINNEYDWNNTAKGNYSLPYTGFIGCVKTSNHSEICFMPGDEDNNGVSDCMDSSCADDPYCGYGAGGSSGGGGGGGMNSNCFQWDGNETGCNANNATCFYHMVGFGAFQEGLCDPIFMQQMQGNMQMDVPPTMIGVDGINDTNKSWPDNSWDYYNYHLGCSWVLLCLS